MALIRILTQIRTQDKNRQGFKPRSFRDEFNAPYPLVHTKLSALQGMVTFWVCRNGWDVVSGSLVLESKRDTVDVEITATLTLTV